MTTYQPGPNLPDDLEIVERAANQNLRWKDPVDGLHRSAVLMEVLERSALAAGWIVPVPDPSTFDEVLLKIAEFYEDFCDHCRPEGWSAYATAEQQAVWDAGIAERRAAAEK